MSTRSYLVTDESETEDDRPVHNPNEQAYLALMGKILRDGSVEPTRTGVPAITLFGETLRLDLTDDRLPLLTTKFVSMKNVLRELLWFISGSTSLQNLERHGVFIWHENATPQFLKSVGLDHRYKPFSDLGPIYSHQWRHYGAKYVDCTTNYNGKGVDQLKEVLRLLREDPSSRRIILLSWNPTQIGECVLPPCHCMAQFRVLRGKELHCHLTQRSADYALGVPYNIASYSILTHLLAKLSGLTATELVVSFGDVHIYGPHIENAKVQLTRKPLASPRLFINLPDYDNLAPIDIDSVTFESFSLKDYRHLPTLTYELCA